MTAPTAAPDLQEGLRRLWAKSRANLVQAIVELEDAVAGASAGTLDDEERRLAERSAHKLIGSVGAFGFFRAAELARILEQRFADGPLDGEAVVMCAEILEELAAELDVDELPLASGPSAPADVEDGCSNSLLVVHPDDHWSEAVALAASDHGFSALRVDDAESAHATLEGGEFAVLVIRLVDGDAGESVLRLLDLVEKLEPRPVTLVIGDGTSAVDRVEASRRGVDRFFGSTPNPSDLVTTVVELTESETQDGPRILMVDDDDVVLEKALGLLDGEGFNVSTLNDPTRLWEVLESFQPDLVILDWQMPEVTGGELCRALRADPSWSVLPVLVLTARKGAKMLRAAFEAGADDFVTKPFVGPELVGRIHNRLERLRLLQELADRDVLTGLTHRRAGHRDLARLLASAESAGEPLAIAMVEIDDLGGVSRRTGSDVADRLLVHVASLLRRHFRGREVVSAWSRERFVVGMFGMRASDAAIRVAEVFERITHDPIVAADGRRVAVTLSGGVAEFPADGATVDDLVWKTDDAARAASATGGSQVLQAGLIEQYDAGIVDVVVVEDDDQLGELLGHALTIRGLRHEWLRDGVDAARALTSDGPEPASLQARVILLDVNLPGLSGMAVLRRMSETGVLSRSRVIMLTARSAEADVIAALSLGAVDHVAKPFSMPVLMERIRQHLHS